MTAAASRLLCIDLQADAFPDLSGQQTPVAGARQLLALGRRLNWQIVHTRRRTQPVIRARAHSASAGLNPLMSEHVCFHDDRSLASAPGLPALLHAWRNETVLVVAFDPVALLSCLLACHEPGPRMVLVEDVMSLGTFKEACAIDAFHGAAWRLAFGATSLARLLAEAGPQGAGMASSGALTPEPSGLTA